LLVFVAGKRGAGQREAQQNRKGLLRCAHGRKYSTILSKKSNLRFVPTASQTATSVPQCCR
jgi:hypothetical protein